MDICVIIRGFLCFNIFCTLLLMLLFHIREGSKFSNGLQVQTIQTGDLDDKQSKLLSAIPKLLVELREQMVPYPNGYFYGRGIVLTVGIFQLSFAKVNLKMIELSNTRLPIEIWYSSEQISEDQIMVLFDSIAKVNLSVCCFEKSQCRNREKTWQLNSNHVYKPQLNDIGKAFPYKPAAIISSTFTEVFFLDSDAYVARDPEELFHSDPMYHKFGVLFHPDAHKSRQDPSLWQLLNTTCASNEYELDSSTILVNKKRVWNGLYMTKLINDNHQSFYGIVTDGDKDTFRIAFRYLNIEYYIVTIPCSTGLFNGTHFCGFTLCKTDSLGQHIYINHVHIFKYESISYSLPNLEYTRMALTDGKQENLFDFKHCRTPNALTSCFHIYKHSNSTNSQCLHEEIQSDEIDQNRVFLSKTNNLMPNFVDNLLKYLN